MLDESNARLLKEGDRFGDYTVVKLLGKGGMGGDFRHGEDEPPTRRCSGVPGQARPLTLTAAELPADGVVTLDVPYTDDLTDPKSVRVSVPVVTADALAGAHWRVTLNGSAVPRGLVGRAVVRNGIVYGTVKHGGLMILVR